MGGGTVGTEPGGEPLLALVDADLGPPGRRAPLLTGVTLALRRGEIGVLIGPNGAGKTTLLRSLAGLWPLRRGTRMPAGSGFDFRRVGLLIEDPASQFVATSVGGEIDFALESLGGGPAEIAARREEILRALGLLPLASRDPGTLSPGEQERALVAAALAPGPSVLLLDDPFLYLGPAESHRAWASVTQAVREGVIGAVLLATHDPESTWAADRVGVLEHGRLLTWDAPGSVWAMALPESVDRPVPTEERWSGGSAHAP